MGDIERNKSKSKKPKNRTVTYKLADTLAFLHREIGIRYGFQPEDINPNKS